MMLESLMLAASPVHEIVLVPSVAELAALMSVSRRCWSTMVGGATKTMADADVAAVTVMLTVPSWVSPPEEL